MLPSRTFVFNFLAFFPLLFFVFVSPRLRRTRRHTHDIKHTLPACFPPSAPSIFPFSAFWKMLQQGLTGMRFKWVMWPRVPAGSHNSRFFSSPCSWSPFSFFLSFSFFLLK